MPSKDTAESSNQHWSKGDQVEELRGKFLLKKKDSDAYRESSKNEIKQNEKAISNLRHSNRAKRITLAQDENGDERVIKTVFKNDRTERLSLQRNTAPGAISEMDQKVCEGGKLLNKLGFEREKREKKLEELNVMYDQMLRLEQKSPEQKDDEKTVTRLENDLDKALIKYDTARIISRRYQEILETLKEESLTQPARLDAMEQALIQQNNELKELKIMARDAMQGRDAAKQQLSRIEQAAYEARRRRDQELTATKKEVERRKEQAEKNERRAVHIKVAANDNCDHKQFLKQQQKRENQKRILSYEEAYQEIREATYVTDIHDVIGRVEKQKETLDHLQNQVRTLEAEREKLMKEKERLTEEHHQQKFYGATRLERGQQLIKKMQGVLDEDEKTKELAINKSKRLGDILLQVKTGVSALLDKLVDVQPIAKADETGDVFGEVSLCSQKMQTLKDDIEKARQYSDMNVGVTRDNFQDFLETKLPADKTRIKVEESSMELAEFDLDSQENDETLNRNDIKLMGQRLLDTRLKPKGKKGRKK